MQNEDVISRQPVIFQFPDLRSQHEHLKLSVQASLNPTFAANRLATTHVISEAALISFAIKPLFQEK